MPGFPRAVLDSLAELARKPYENLSKIVASAERGRRGGGTRGAEGALALHQDWLASEGDLRVGGTCFSLTYWLARRLREAGLDCAYLMGDQRTRANVHCALRLDHGGAGYLLDPGYLIFEPIPLPRHGLACVAWCPPNEVRLEDLPLAFRLWSGPRGGLKHRFDFRKEAVDEGEFMRHWEASYAFEMMRYPVLNRVVDGTQYYLQKRNLVVRTAEGSAMTPLDRVGLVRVAYEVFGVPEALAREAIDVVLERDGQLFARGRQGS